MSTGSGSKEERLNLARRGPSDEGRERVWPKSDGMRRGRSDRDVRRVSKQNGRDRHEGDSLRNQGRANSDSDGAYSGASGSPRRALLSRGVNDDGPFGVGAAAVVSPLLSPGGLLSSLNLLVLDETDALLGTLGRYATKREKESRARHPKPAAVLLKSITAARASRSFSRRAGATEPTPLQVCIALHSLTRLTDSPLNRIMWDPPMHPAASSQMPFAPCQTLQLGAMPCAQSVRIGRGQLARELH